MTTNKEKVIQVLTSLENGDSTAIQEFINPHKYIQHNLTFPNGREVMLGALNDLKAAGTKVNIQRVLVDGDFVVTHTDYDFFGPKVGFDIFRFENGQIVEHWDNLQQKVDKTPSGHTMLDGSIDIQDEDKTAENKEFVKNFVSDILMGHNPEKLTSYFEGDHYIQHNPAIADGLSGLGIALEGMAKQGIEMIYDKIHMVIGQGNFVLTVSEGTFAGAHTSFYDLFRVENGKIAEHWDVMETIIPEEERKNNNDKF
ncbi:MULTISPECIES: nuclear transport factor 2 family protein [Bacillaceae]|uniref:nuclear transport factor 2 family protein n=1 Tax=Bacillaceae TaxID=186817 RepID=UPI001BDEA61A|nr:MULTISPECIES: nuclear transport factor 2 family protein [Bacillaceae]MDX8363338.1 nuclear transport factor 2 family protein [Cytobacillus sp. IB215316]